MTTETKVNIGVCAIALCPKCNRQISVKCWLTEEQLVTGNTTEMASYHVKAMRLTVEAEKKARGWREEMCGRCADPLTDEDMASIARHAAAVEKDAAR